MKAFASDFRKFLMRGNVLDLAVAVVVGTAFNAVVQSFANDVLMGFVGAAFGKPNFDNLAVDLGSCSTNAAGVKVCNGHVAYGSFLTVLVNFVIIAFSVFIAIKLFEKLQNMRSKAEAEGEVVPLTTDQELLTEIRDLLRSDQSS